MQANPQVLHCRRLGMNVTKLSDIKRGKICTYEFSITDFSKNLRFIGRKTFFRQHLTLFLFEYFC